MPILRSYGGEPAHHAVAEANLPRVGLVEAREEPQERRLAAARGAEEREELAVANGEVGPVHRGDGAEALDDAADRDLHRLYFFFSSSHLASMSLRKRVLSASERLAATASS